MISNGSFVKESVPGLIVPSDIIIAGLLCSNKADKVPTGGLSHATTAIVPSKPLALKCSQIASLVTSRPIREYRISRVPFLIPSDVAIVNSGATSRILKLLFFSSILFLRAS